MSFEDNVIEIPFFTPEECEKISAWAFEFEQEPVSYTHLTLPTKA